MHLYIHVPFCARRCSYCDFAIAVRARTPVSEFVAAIRSDWQHSLDRQVMAGATIDTIYFGGGTPSRIGGEAVADLVRMFRSDAPVADDVEITVEANPDDVTPELARSWRSAGVNRISLGVQSHDPAVLEWMHRTHRVEQVAPAVAMLRDAGIDNLSVDLIFALPDEVPRDWDDDIERTLALSPDHVSLYGLTVEPHTPLARWVARGVVAVTDDSRYADEYLRAHRRLGEAGFEHYEVSNFARPGRRSRHNQSYWSGAQYLGLGPSAHSFLAGERSWKLREWQVYLEAAAAGRSLEAGREQLSAEAHGLERLYLGLRTDGGLPEADLPPESARDWLREGWAVRHDGRIRLTAQGWLRLDALVSRVGAS